MVLKNEQKQFLSKENFSSKNFARTVWERGKQNMFRECSHWQRGLELFFYWSIKTSTRNSIPTKQAEISPGLLALTLKWHYHNFYTIIPNS
jgi:hypothetical protein